MEPVASAGTDNVIYRLGNDMSLRLPRSPATVGQVGKEYRWLPKFAALPLHVPSGLAQGVPASGYPWDWSRHLATWTRLGAAGRGWARLGAVLRPGRPCVPY
ncbi:MAG: phosphotransferase [Alphaproteobacteria bacterium]